VINRSSFDRWIFESYSPTLEGLALYRIFTALFFLFFLLPDVSFYSVLADYPDDFFAPPPGPMALFDRFPPELFLQVMHVVLMLSWTAVLIGLKTKIASVVAGLSMLILLGFLFSLGKINHEILLVVVPIVMAFSNWGGAYSFDQHFGSRNEKAEGWPLTMLALIIGFMMFTAGFPKILGGWLDLSTQATQGHLLNQFYVRERQELMSAFAIRIESAFIWELLDWATVLFETMFIVAVLKSSWTRLFVCFAVLFHFSIMLTMNIAFLPNFAAYAAFIKWNWVYKKLTGISEKIRSDNFVILYGNVLVLIFFTLWILGKRGFFITSEEPNFYEVTFLSAAVLIVLFAGFRKIWQWNSYRAKRSQKA